MLGAAVLHGKGQATFVASIRARSHAWRHMRHAVGWLWAVVSIAFSGSLAQAAPTVDEIAQHIQRAYASVPAFQVAWTMQTHPIVGADIRAVKVFSTFARDEYASSGQKRYRKYTEPTNTGGRQECVFVSKDDVTESQIIEHTPGKSKPGIGNYIVHKGEGRTRNHMNQAVQLLECMGSPFYDGPYLDVWRMQCFRTGAKTGSFTPFHPFSLVAALGSGKYAVLPAQQSVDGAPCWVVEYPSMDKLWLDPKCGYAVRKREWHWGPGEPLMVRYHNRELTAVGAGVWLPKRATREVFMPSSATSGGSANETRFTNQLVVTMLRTKNVPNTLFDFHPVPGSTAIDNSKIDRDGAPVRLSYIVGKSEEDTEASLNRSIDRVNVTKGFTGYRLVLLLVNVGVVVVIVLFCVRKWRVRGR